MTDRPIHEARPGRGLGRGLGLGLGLGSPADWARDLVVAAIIGVWVGMLGPFGNYLTGPLYTRIAFDLVLAILCVAAFGVTLRLGVRAGRRVGVSPWISAPVSIALTCLPLSVAGAWVGAGFFPVLKHALSPSDWCVEALILLLPIVGGYAGLLHLFGRRPPPVRGRTEAAAGDAPPLALPEERPITALATSPTTSPAPRLARRVPGAQASDILALSVEDHYVRIHTASGSHLVLMRLSDAIDEMDGVEGLRVHRSWWVARQAVRSVRLNGRGGRLMLHAGLQAPVARSALSVVRAAGWA